MTDAPLTVAAHRARILADLTPLPARLVPLDRALGCVLAVDVATTTPLPLFDNSSMDGYAVVRSDLIGADGAAVTLPVVHDIPAGSTARLAIAPGQAARIMTGAPMPDGADAVVKVELTDAGTQRVQITHEPTPGEHIRRAGEDLAAGAVVLRAGTRMGGRHVAAAAGAGHAEVSVHPRPRVAVISTGTELVAPGTVPEHGQIPDSNSYLLAGAVTEAGCEAIRVGAVPDDAQALREVLARVSPDVDAIVLSGGVSVGAYDVVKEVLAPLPSMWFGPVAMQPGKPQGWGRLTDGTPVFALPGNPVSVYVSFEVFVGPALRVLAGERGVEPAFTPARAGVSWRSPAGREQYMPVVIARDGAALVLRPASGLGSGSHLVGGLAGADGLARVTADVAQVAEGDELEVLIP